VQRCLALRQKYIRTSLQRTRDNPKNNPDIWKIYPEAPPPRWTYNREDNTWKDHKNDLPKYGVGETFNIAHCEIPGEDNSGNYFQLESGVYEVYYEGTLSSFIVLTEGGGPIVDVPTLRDYYRDLDSIILAASDGESKSFAFKRLQYLDGKWNLYILLNERQEMLDSKVFIQVEIY
jgi:AMP deaminase